MGHALKFVLAFSLCLAAQVQAVDVRFDAARRQMLAEIQETVAKTGRATGKARLAPEVMAALGTVPRHEFVPDALDAVAYANRPLPVGHGQTISQPYIVALMTDLLDVGDDAVVGGVASAPPAQKEEKPRRWWTSQTERLTTSSSTWGQMYRPASISWMISTFWPMESRLAASCSFRSIRSA